MNNILLVIAVFGLLSAGAIVLQIFLSEKESKWPGLILPAITLLFSLLVVFGLTAYTTSAGIIQNGKVIMNSVNNYPLGAILTGLYIFALYNIPTVILLVIFFACREKRKKNREIEKMNIQDLE